MSLDNVNKVVEKDSFMWMFVQFIREATNAIRVLSHAI